MANIKIGLMQILWEYILIEHAIILFPLKKLEVLIFKIH